MIKKIGTRVVAVFLLGLLGAGVCFADLPAPVALPVTVTTIKNTATQVTFVGQHTTEGPFTYQALTQPSHGQLSAVEVDHVTYTPATGYVGGDSFTYSATDAGGESAPATVSITVSAAASAVASVPMLSTYALAVVATLMASAAVLRKRSSD